MVKKKVSKSGVSKKAAKYSLVENMNNRKEAGVSRSKKKSTISKKAYGDMQKGWPST